MASKHIIILLVSFFLFLNGTNKPISEQIIIWEQGLKLNFNDFQAAPDRENRFNALTSCGIGYSINIKDKKITITNEAVFDKSKSWIKKYDPSVLKHEQRHFDICEIYRRYFCMRLEQAKLKDFKSTPPLIDSIYEDIMTEMSSMQAKYDAATNHSLNKEKQEEWNKKIENALKLSKNYNAILYLELP